MLSLIDGGPLTDILGALQARLTQVFPEDKKFTHRVVPPRMNEADWKNMSQFTPFIGVGWIGWRGAKGGRVFNGDLQFGIFLLTRQRMQFALVGDKTAPGVFGMGCLAIAAVNGMSMSGRDGKSLGSAVVMQMDPLFGEDWSMGNDAGAVISVTIPGVELFDPRLQADLADFLELGEVWEIGESAEKTVTEVRKGG